MRAGRSGREGRGRGEGVVADTVAVGHDGAGGHEDTAGRGHRHQHDGGGHGGRATSSDAEGEPSDEEEAQFAEQDDQRGEPDDQDTTVGLCEEQQYSAGSGDADDVAADDPPGGREIRVGLAVCVALGLEVQAGVQLDR
jgi:hypothetical protein